MGFSEFIERHTAKVQPLERLISIAYWEAALSGTREDFDRYSRLRLELERIYSDPGEFDLVRNARDSGVLEDPLQRRIADLLYLRYLGNQVDPGMLERVVELSSAIENRFNVFRAEVDGRTMTSNEVGEALRESRDSLYRRRVWEASKEAGAEVAPDLLELVEMRNGMARSLGFEDFHSMSLSLSEQDGEMLERVFDELDELTRSPFLELKEKIDDSLADQCGVDRSALMPWHYHDPFFQEAPGTASPVDSDPFAGRDIVGIAERFYRSVGMPVEDITARSDLYERKGKNPHAFCMDVDRLGDVRILCNIRDDIHWMETVLHELGHAVYDKYVGRGLPWLLRTYPHLCLTEASAMYFGRFARDPKWVREAVGDGPCADSHAGGMRRAARNKQLVFARWVQVMFRFERELYRDPGRDLNGLWWDLAEKYQAVRRPDGRDEPDWASKIHIVSSPVYYHNYMLGEMIASQVHFRMAGDVPGMNGEESLHGNLSIGRFFREKVYGPGNTVPWTAHIEKVTGEPLTARHFAAQFLESGD